jgi:hypothetical protein
MALALHRFTDGAVPASELRPRSWARPQDVPILDLPIVDVTLRTPARSAKGRAP